MRLTTSCLLAFLSYASLTSAATHDGSLDLERSELLSPVRKKRDEWRIHADKQGEGSRQFILDGIQSKLTTAWDHYRDAALEATPHEQIPTPDEMVQAFMGQHGNAPLVKQPDGSDLISVACATWTNYVERLHQLPPPQAQPEPVTPPRRKGRSSSESSASGSELSPNTNRLSSSPGGSSSRLSRGSGSSSLLSPHKK